MKTAVELLEQVVEAVQLSFLQLTDTLTINNSMKNEAGGRAQ